MYSKDTGKDQMLMTMERALTSGQKAASSSSDSSAASPGFSPHP